VFVCLFYHVI